MNGVRLRQAVLVAAELDPVVARLQSELGFGEPFADPGVNEFGLHNAVFAVGDQFVEVISPTQAGTAAARHLERLGGDGGYMVIFQVDDLEGARARVAELGVRVVWQIDLPDISGTHLHPADTRGALISLDRPLPAESWRWGGPDWERRGRPGGGGGGGGAGRGAWRDDLRARARCRRRALGRGARRGPCAGGRALRRGPRGRRVERDR